MDDKKLALKNRMKAVICAKFGSENDCARAMGWSRQRLNKITNAQKEPVLSELEEIARATERQISEIADIFLAYWSPNG